MNYDKTGLYRQLVLVQFGTDDTDLTRDFRLTASDVMFFGNIIVIYPGSSHLH